MAIVAVVVAPSRLPDGIEELAADVGEPQCLVAQPLHLGRQRRRLAGVAVPQLRTPDPYAIESLRHGCSLPARLVPVTTTERVTARNPSTR